MELKKYIVQEKTTILDTMRQIEEGGNGIAFVCRGLKLLAVVTDGDIRRHILRNGSLKQEIVSIARAQYISLPIERVEEAVSVMRRESIMAVPIINNTGEIVEVKFLRDIMGTVGVRAVKAQLQIPLVIMAGGKGTRLRPYTDILPKPLIPIGDRTVTEHIMDRFEEYGCRQIYMIVNYKKNFIKAYFNDNEKERNITFVEEHEYLGTGGGLKLLSGLFHSSFFMSNCDVLIRADYEEILNFHKKNHNIITMVCAQKSFGIPYGTVQFDQESRVIGMEEKPCFHYNVNTGLYVIEPKFLDKIPENNPAHITDVIARCISEKERVGCYLIQDDAWMDMGQLDELERMKEKMGINK